MAKTTDVIFRRWRSGDQEPLALFPGVLADDKGNCSSYQHTGQHGAADYLHVMCATTPAYLCDKDVAALAHELDGIGYTLHQVTRRNRRHTDAIAQALKAR